jgi:hypothetical protein
MAAIFVDVKTSMRRCVEDVADIQRIGGCASFPLVRASSREPDLVAAFAASTLRLCRTQKTGSLHARFCLGLLDAFLRRTLPRICECEQSKEEDGQACARVGFQRI